jgi:hypothetical protein
MPFLTAPTSFASHRHAVVGGGFNPLADACCAPAPAAAPALPAAAPRRTKLAELDPNVHCSIIGTCLTTHELRKLVPRYAATLDRKHASDLEIHHTAVELSTDGGPAAKELNKALDLRHALAIKRFKMADDEAALGKLWREALANGDVPGAYWALMTHPATGFALRRTAFGDVHMLSHLVGASNRADIRRLAALEEECRALKDQNARQQARLHELGGQHETSVRALELQLASKPATQAPADEDTAQLRQALALREQKLLLHTARRAEAERLLAAREEALQAAHDALRQLREERDHARAETQVLETALDAALGGAAPGDDGAAGALAQLKGRCIVYVGGRPGSSAALANLAAAAGGELLVHDGGIEDRRGLLSSMLSRADFAVFPVDCISHNAMQVAKQTCARLGVAIHPLRTASVASFLELLQRLGTKG